MTIQELKQVITWAEEGKLQWKGPTKTDWRDVEYNNTIYGTLYSDEQFSCYRRKPSPTLRPWRPEEVPVGALIRFSKNSSIQGKYLILASDKTGIVHCNTPDMSTPTLCKLTYEFILKFEHSLDHGKTWLPCGVMSE